MIFPKRGSSRKESHTELKRRSPYDGPAGNLRHNLQLLDRRVALADPRVHERQVVTKPGPKHASSTLYIMSSENFFWITVSFPRLIPESEDRCGSDPRSG